jgi:hypothetical protein
MEWMEFTNDCQCHDYNEETDESTPSEHCYGDCWRITMENLTEACGEFFEDKYKYLYRCEYDSERYSEYSARGAAEFISAMADRISDFRIKCKMIETQSEFLHQIDRWFDTVDDQWCDHTGELFDPNRKEKALRLVIYHHDAPTGFPMTVFKRPYIG